MVTISTSTVSVEKQKDLRTWTLLKTGSGLITSPGIGIDQLTSPKLVSYKGTLISWNNVISLGSEITVVLDQTLV